MQGKEANGDSLGLSFHSFFKLMVHVLNSPMR